MKNVSIFGLQSACWLVDHVLLIVMGQQLPPSIEVDDEFDMEEPEVGLEPGDKFLICQLLNHENYRGIRLQASRKDSQSPSLY
jgi:hypothetical protein